MLRNFTLVSIPTYTGNSNIKLDYLYKKKLFMNIIVHFIQFCKIQIEVETIDIPIITFRFYQII